MIGNFFYCVLGDLEIFGFDFCLFYMVLVINVVVNLFIWVGESCYFYVYVVFFSCMGYDLVFWFESDGFFDFVLMDERGIDF